MASWGDITGLNRGYVLELYEKFRQDPNSVDADTRELFARWTPPVDAEAGAATAEAPPESAPSSATPDSRLLQKAVGAVNLAQSIRRYGHLAARLDPLGVRPPVGDPSLLPEWHGVTEEDLRRLPSSLIRSPLCEGAANMADVVESFRRLYCSRTGYDYAHVFVPEERRWLRHAAECGQFRSPNDPINPVALLDRLSQVEAFEKFLHRTFPGKTRFSIEGNDMLVPILDEVIGEAAEAGTRHILIGMAHRGRLNVMAHVLNKPYSQILAEFKDPVSSRTFREDMAWTGDVKYHAGAHRAIKGGEELELVISMPPNPSHLEAVDPVVEGMARAAGTDVKSGGASTFDPAVSLPILIHGDAAFPGQGVVAETLNLSRLPGYGTGGTIHIIVNNQLGFTTRPEDAYSTSYASGLARGFKIPIVHVNADDPEACVEVARLAFAYRAKFQRDFLIDLIGYRRYGHNEGDEPAFTQPIMYRKIAEHPTVREIWTQTLGERGEIEREKADALLANYVQRLQSAMEGLQPEDYVEPEPETPPPGAASKAETAVPLDRLRELNTSLLNLPAGFAVHRKLERAREKRGHLLDNPGERTIDWAAAEELALASILADGTAIRLTGEDVERGTFSHRHAVLHDVDTGRLHIPLQAIPQARAAFEIRNSPLTENAVVGFEYGYNIQEPSRLVIWEAQYGDFINGAQTMIDEFLVSARGKWGVRPSLVMLLPHAHEGQGPDHASARPERFLQLAADLNMRVANCTTAAQYFHLLRRQAALLLVDPLPLIVLSPKSLLRHPLVTSAPAELSEGRFRMVIADRDAAERAAAISKILICSGKIYVDLMSAEQRAARPDIAICRVEQLYPVPMRDLRAAIDSYPNAQEVTWIQEEPDNMGAWEFIRPHLQEVSSGRAVRRIARPRSASPAEGSAARHSLNQQFLVDQAFGLHGEAVAQKERRAQTVSS
jgi:2-oxoglutarate dehydrogenase E1 component